MSAAIDDLKHEHEAILFPAMEKAGIRKDDGPIGVMLHEHEELHAMPDVFDARYLQVS